MGRPGDPGGSRVFHWSGSGQARPPGLCRQARPCDQAVALSEAQRAARAFRLVVVIRRLAGAEILLLPSGVSPAPARPDFAIAFECVRD